MSRKTSFLVIALHYVISMVVGWLAYKAVPETIHPYWAVFAADAAATVYIWALGLVHKNVSFYDPYWSVAPPVILTWWLMAKGFVTVPSLLMMVAVWFWAIRLTWNWAITFHGMAHEDWRYTKFRTECHPIIFHLINFFGLNMVPTIVVFLGMIPALALTEIAPESAGTNVLTVAGCLVSIAAAVLQLVADTQSHRFRAAHPGEVCNVGVWKHGRHPNYFGEIMMWWGIWLMYVSIVGLSVNTWYIAGPLSVTVLFCVVSIPLMEARQLANKPQYAEYKKQTRWFI